MYILAMQKSESMIMVPEIRTLGNNSECYMADNYVLIHRQHCIICKVLIKWPW